MDAILEIISKSGVLGVCYHLELTIGIQEEYQADSVVGKAEYCVSKLEDLHIG